ncbi:MAG: hypothetical protein HFG49_01575 [Lachnospiraceae bacterium]|jgi:FtsZ-binding cell division protein ZapB|nr:hypothetical protein [Lachnospiraceae bacterium]
MRELSVYYCVKCGYYAYYQLSKNAVCPKCDEKMKLLNIPYQKFMDFNCEERDELLSREILRNCPSVVSRITAAHKAANQRETIALLSAKINELEEENKKLNETVTWMHQTIWEMIRNEKSKH